MQFHAKIRCHQVQSNRDEWNDTFELEIIDATSGVLIAELRLTEDEFMQAFITRRHEVALSHVGKIDDDMQPINKVPEHTTFTVLLPSETPYANRGDVALALAAQLPEADGWRLSSYFGARNSFSRKDGCEYAHVRAVRYVESEMQKEKL